MKRDDAERILPDLRDRVRTYQHQYFVEGRPTISDREFDRLFDELLAIESEFPDLATPDSPSTRVGSDLSADFREVEHTVPVLSLDKAYTVGDLSTWIARTNTNVGRELSFVVEEKMDGFSIVLYYEQGVLERAVTRGNGSVGNDVTANVKTIRSVPLRLTRPETIAVRGEVVLPVEEFARLNEKMETPYANPRNLAAGTIRRIKSSEVASVPLVMFAYEGYYQGSVGDRPPIESHHAMLDDLIALGFTVNKNLGYFAQAKATPETRSYVFAMTGTFDDIEAFVEREVAERRRRPYEIDGLVVKVDELDVRDALGFTGHHPRWAIAFKFEAPQAESVVRAIDVQIGRTGRATPVARIEPVVVGGSTVSNVTLHNQDYIDTLELAIGDAVAVSKRGDVIPAIERVIEKGEEAAPVWQMPPLCPSCGNDLVREGAHHFCTNFDCPDRRRGLLYFFVGSGQMDIDNLGPETLDVLVRHSFVKDVADIYEFDPGSLNGLPGFGEKKISLIRAGIEKSKAQPFRVVLPSLGIPELGPKVTELLIDGGFRSIGELFSLADRDDLESLVAIRGIGEKTARVIIEELKDDALRALVARLRAAGLSFEAAPPDEGADSGVDRIFDGQSWCVTGSFETFKPRSIAMDEVKKRGGRVVSDVTGKTTHLLAGEGAGSKLSKARELGVTVVDESAFRQMIGR